jgi:hypothetical protein
VSRLARRRPAAGPHRRVPWAVGDFARPGRRLYFRYSVGSRRTRGGSLGHR